VEKLLFPYEIRRMNCEHSIPVACVVDDPAFVYSYLNSLQKLWPGEYLIFDAPQSDGHGSHRMSD
jgi:hypothetical protein